MLNLYFVAESRARMSFRIGWKHTILDTPDSLNRTFCRSIRTMSDPDSSDRERRILTDHPQHPVFDTALSHVHRFLIRVRVALLSAIAFAVFSVGLMWGARVAPGMMGVPYPGIAYIGSLVVAMVLSLTWLGVMYARKPWYWATGDARSGYRFRAGVLLGGLVLLPWFVQPLLSVPSVFTQFMFAPIESRVTDPLAGLLLLGVPMLKAWREDPMAVSGSSFFERFNYNSVWDLHIADGNRVKESRLRRARGGHPSQDDADSRQGPSKGSRRGDRNSNDENDGSEEDLIDQVPESVKEEILEQAREGEDSSRSSDDDTDADATDESDDSALDQGGVWNQLEFQWRAGNNVDVTFDDIGGMESKIEELERQLIRPAESDRERYEKLGVTLPNILLYGPPGTGKSYLAEAVIGELETPYLLTSGGDITSRWVNASSSRVSSLFNEAELLAKEYGMAVVFIDEIDAVLPDRRNTQGGNQHQEDKKVVDEFLKHLDDCTDKNVVVIGTTNYRDDLDDAAIRSGRIDLQLEVPLPEKEARTKVLRAQLESRAHEDIPTKELATMAEYLDGATAADLTRIVEDAALSAANNGYDQIEAKHLWASIDDTVND